MEASMLMDDRSHHADSIFEAMQDSAFFGHSGAGSPAEGRVSFRNSGALPSAFAVSDFAAASIAMAGLGVAQWLAALNGKDREVIVDRRLASMWFAWSIRPDGWTMPSPWDPIAGDYRTADGWIRLHTNAPRHRHAAITALGCAENREHVEQAVLHRNADELEADIVARGGCAAAMRTLEDWQASPAGTAVRNEPLIIWQVEDSDPPFRNLENSPKSPLAGLKVLDLTRVLAGPVATRFLAQLGADVLRIDPPIWDEPGVFPEVMLGKRSARLDLSKHSDRGIFETLLSECDVLVHGYRPGALDNLGYDPDTRRRLNPGIIEASLDAYGWHGPWKTRRGFDSLVQMSTGIADAGMRAFGTGKPKPLPVQALDHATGYLMAFAVLHSILLRSRDRKHLSARLSLAKAADFLVQYPQDTADAFSLETSSDLSSSIEETGWGKARRLRLPLEIDGVEFQTVVPARLIGHDSPCFKR